MLRIGVMQTLDGATVAGGGFSPIVEVETATPEVTGSNPDGTITGTNGSDGSTGVAGGDGDSAANIVDDLTSANSSGINIGATGGEGGYGGNGAAGIAGQTTQIQNGDTIFYTTPSGLNGASGALDGVGGDATAQLSAASLTETTESLGVNVTATGGGVQANGSQQGGNGGGGGYGGYDGYYDQSSPSASNPDASYSGGDGGNGGDGAVGGAGGGATATIQNSSFDAGQFNLNLQASSVGGSSSEGGSGGNGAEGGAGAGNGGNGGNGGDGGSATTSVSGNVVTGTGEYISLAAIASSGAGSGGGTGGQAGYAYTTDGVGDTGSSTSVFGAGGNGGNGGNSGDASAIIAGNTITASRGESYLDVELYASVQVGVPGSGASGGSAGQNSTTSVGGLTTIEVAGTPGTAGVSGAGGSASISITDNDVTLSGPGVELDIQADVVTYPYATTYPYTAPLTPADFTFSGNDFNGGGSGSLYLGTDGGINASATINVALGELSIGGSPADNVVTGFTAFLGSAGYDSFTDGPGDQTYVLQVSPVPGGGASLGTFVFTPGHGSDVIYDFGAGDTIGLDGFGTAFQSFSALTAATTDTNGAGALITTPDGGSILLAGVQPSALTSGEFSFSSTACYCAGTLIRTVDGDVPVEDLRIGDHVATLGNCARPIMWIGQSAYLGRFIAGNRDVLPILISRGALADNLPSRDLYVSPLHAMYLDGMLIAARDLLNGTSIVQLKSVEEVRYFHIELETHDVIFAEGAPSETFVDDDSRGMFHNAADYRCRYPAESPTGAVYCAPRVDCGYELETVRRRLAALSRDASGSGQVGAGAGAGELATALISCHRAYYRAALG